MSDEYKGGSMPGMNKALGLPFGKMAKVAICFDVDGTLLTTQGAERVKYTTMVFMMYKAFKNAQVVVWSGGGAQYAAQRGHELGLDDYVWEYLSKLQHTELRKSGYLILAIDDIQDTAIGDINLIVRQ